MSNNIEHPSYYNVGKIEVIDYIYDKGLNFALGNVIKYTSRAGFKHGDNLSNEDKAIEDLKKARQYLDFEIQNRIKQKNILNK